jgi:pantothenate kinase
MTVATTTTTTTTTNNRSSDYEESWEPEVAQKILQQVQSNINTNVGRPYMVAIVGIPGGGKSISSLLLANHLEAHGVATMIMPHDGYHYPLEMLKLWPNAEDAIYRRGAPDTFDPQALQRDLERIRNSNNDNDESMILVPGFDHGRGDPEPDQHAFDRNRHKVVLCEGLVSLLFLYMDT